MTTNHPNHTPPPPPPPHTRTHSCTPSRRAAMPLGRPCARQPWGQQQGQLWPKQPARPAGAQEKTRRSPARIATRVTRRRGPRVGTACPELTRWASALTAAAKRRSHPAPREAARLRACRRERAGWPTCPQASYARCDWRGWLHCHLGQTMVGTAHASLRPRWQR
jgi:hypothetical protein